MMTQAAGFALCVLAQLEVKAKPDAALGQLLVLGVAQFALGHGVAAVAQIAGVRVDLPPRVSQWDNPQTSTEFQSMSPSARCPCKASEFSRAAVVWLAAVLLVVPPLDARADNALETIQVTATRRPESTFEVPVATTVVTREAIAKAPLQTVMDALRGTPGVFIQQTTPGQGVVVLRGLKGSEILHVVDGFRLNNAIFRNAPSQYVALVDAQSLERIEVARGPMSSLYGSDAMGGVVQMLGWEPDFSDARDWSGTARLRAAWGSADRSTLGRGEAAVGRDGLALSGGLSWQDVGERRTGGGERMPFSAYEAVSADIKLRARLAEGQEWTASAQFTEQPQTPRHDELVAGFGQETPNSAEFLFEPQEREFLHLRWRGTKPGPWWDNAEAHLGQQLIDDSRRTRDFGSFSQDREHNRVTTRGLTFQAFKEFGASHAVTWGADLYDDEVASSRTRRDIRGGEAVERAPRFPDGSTMRQVGIYLADDWAIAPALDVLGSLRWSDVRTRLPAAAAGADVEVEDAGVSGNLGVSWALRPELRLVSNVGYGFRAPNVFDLGTFGDRPGNRFSVPNTALDAETVTTVDAGFKFRNAATDVELIAFRSFYRDKITAVLTGQQTDSGRLVVQSRNATSLGLSGIEFGLRRALTESLQLRLASTWTRGDERFEGSDYPADRIPPLAGRAGVSWRISAQVLADAWFDYARRQDRYSPRDLIDPRIDPDGTNGWTSWNVRLGWEPTPHLHTTLQLLNAADTRYREFGSGIDAPGLGWHLAVEFLY